MNHILETTKDKKSNRSKIKFYWLSALLMCDRHFVVIFFYEKISRFTKFLGFSDLILDIFKPSRQKLR